MAEGGLALKLDSGEGVSATLGFRDPITGRPRCSNSRDEMYEIYQSWALQNYGDTGKTKTVTRRKYRRIINILTGEEPATSENSKFRFWVKAKGFSLGPPTKDSPSSEQTLYIPTKSEQEDGEKIYKRVAIVEDFFDIIYNVHVEMDGRGGKHAGQKRTYRAIAETYSFLPREAVTRFLMSCADCQKRMHLSMETNNNGDTPGNHVTDDPPIIDFSLPITTTYLNHMKSKKGFLDENYVYHADGEESMSSVTSHPASLDRSPSPALVPAERYSPKPTPESSNTIKKAELADIAETKPSLSPASLQLRSCSSMTEKEGTDDVVTMSERNGNGLAETEDQKPLNMAVSTVREDKGHPERKRRASNDSLDSSTKASESAADDGKDEDDDNDDEDDEKLQSQSYDPERLKSFNMFVRLFVDENLDRSVPISKQPKDKIQAILEACDRQFPEFHDRSRKRIRTYLKSCRRMRRSKEANGWEQLRPTPPHLTSAAAEGILAQACENESQNAKRMRMGLEPLPATVMGSGKGTASNSASNTPSQTSPHVSPTPSLNQPREREQTRQQQTSPNGHASNDRQSTGSAASEFSRHTPSLPPPTGFRPPHELPSPFFTNSNGIFRPGFPSSYQHPAHQHPPSLHHASPIASQIQNGPTDLSMKSGTGKSAGSSKNQLNPTEVATIKQLIAGYRESAAFLYRSADELEQLLLQQN